MTGRQTLLSKRLASQRRDARRSALHRGDFATRPALCPPRAVLSGFVRRRDVPTRVISTRKTATRTPRGPVASRYPRDATPGLRLIGPPLEAAPHEPWLI